MVFQHYKTLLSVDKQQVYEQLYNGIKARDKAIKLPKINEKDLIEVMDYIFLDNPVFFYFKSYSYSLAPMYSVLYPSYLYNEDEILGYLNEIGRLTKLFKKESNVTDYDFVLYLNGLFKKKITYHNDESFECHSIIGSLLNKSAVCDGISKLFKYLCDVNNILCVVVEGNARSTYNSTEYGGHAWNKVFVNGFWSNIDLTYNMTTGSDFIRHDYCFLTDKAISASHKRERDERLICDNEDLNFYRNFELVMDNQLELKEKLKKCFLSGREMFEFKLPRARKIEEVIDKVVKITEEILGELRIFRAFKVEYNLEQLIFFVLLK